MCLDTLILPDRLAQIWNHGRGERLLVAPKPWRRFDERAPYERRSRRNGLMSNAPVDKDAPRPRREKNATVRYQRRDEFRE